MSGERPQIVRPSIPPRRRFLFPFWIAGVLLIPVLFVLALGVWWFGFRVEVGAEEVLILVNKTGKALPTDLTDEFSDQVVLYDELIVELAKRDGLTGSDEENKQTILNSYKGVRLDMLGAGRHFKNPYSYKRIKRRATIIDQGRVGVLIRKFGKPLPFPKTVATEPDERGPVDRILKPGRYDINTLAYDVQTFPAIEILAGHVGVVTLLSGTDPTTKNTYTVEPGEKGVQRETRPPGWEYYNPYLQQIEIVDTRSHKYDMLGEGAIHFPSNDSFTITIEGTIEWKIIPNRVPEVTVKYGDEEDILNKIILPYARSISRIQGSKLQARDFISGSTRTEFQHLLLAQLRQACSREGVDIRSALVRDIQTPSAIATPISLREQADQEIERAKNQMEEARERVEKIRQEEMRERNTAMGIGMTEQVTLVTEAKQRKEVMVTKASRELAVAKLTLEAARKEAEAIIARGQAEANVVRFQYQAKAEPLEEAVKAFGDGRTYAQLFFLEKVAPSIKSVLSNTEGPFADIFKQFQMFPDTAKDQGGEK